MPTAPVAPTPIDDLPTPPSTDDPTNFDARGDAFLGAFPDLQSQTNSLADNVYSNAQGVYSNAVQVASDASDVAADAAQVALDKATTVAAKGTAVQAASDATDAKDAAEALYGDLAAVSAAKDAAVAAAASADEDAATATAAAGAVTTKAGEAATAAAASKSYTGGLGFTFSNTTTDSDPGAGNIRLNNATLASVTYLYVDNSDADGLSASAWLDTFDDSTSVDRGKVYLRDGVTGALAIYRLTGAVADGSGYRKLPVTHVTSSGTFTDGNRVGLAFVPTGDTPTTAAVGYVAKTGAYTVVAADWGKIIDCTSGTFTLTFTAAATLGSGFYCYLKNSGTGVITGPTVDGATLTLGPGDEIIVQCDGSAFHGLKLKGGGWTLLSTQTVSVAVSSIDFTNIPSTGAQLSLEVSGLSHNDGSNLYPTLRLSTNNGSSYGAAYSLAETTGTSAANAFGGLVVLPQYRSDIGLIMGGLTYPVGVSTVANMTVGHSGGVNALRLAFSNSVQTDAGTVKLWIK